MHVFAIGHSLNPADGQKLVALVRALGAELRLDRNTLWHATSRSAKTVAVGMHHSQEAIGRRRYTLIEGDRVVLFDGLPVEASQRFAAYDAAALADHWSELPEALEGQFCAAQVDLSTDEVEILTDTLGLVPAFFGRRGGAFVASNFARIVALVLRMEDIDPLAFASFVGLGWAVERRTFFGGVTALAGGSRHRLTAHGLRSHQHFGASSVASRRSRASIEELRAGLLAVTSAATEAGGPVRCALTAGHDTRVMAALLRVAKIPVCYYTSSDSWRTDIVIGRELAERFGLAHEITDSMSLLDGGLAATSYVRETDGLSSLVQLVDYVEQEQPVDELPITFWGVGGEIGRAGTGTITKIAPNLPVVSRFSHTQRRLLSLKLDDQGLLTEEGRKLVIGFIDRYIDERLHEGWPVRELAEAFYAFERISTWASAGPRRAAKTSDIFNPFSTRTFINYCFALKPSERYVEAPHHRLLMALDPEFAGHRFEFPFLPQRPWLAGVLATRQLWRAIRSGPRRGASVPGAHEEPLFLNRWLATHSDFLRTLVDEAPPPISQLIDRERAIKLLAASSAEQADCRDALLRLATPLWLLADLAAPRVAAPER